MRLIRILLAGVILGVPAAGAFAEGEPVAIVEAVQSQSAPVAALDYVAAGRRIELGPNDSIVLDYLDSCVRERITGGTIRVGFGSSRVANGAVTRIKTACDAGQLAVSQVATNGSSVMAFSAAQRRETTDDLPTPELTLYGASPLVDIAGSGTLVIERLDAPGEHYDIPLGAAHLLRGAFFDFAGSGRALQPGGLYRAQLGALQIVFAVDRDAKPGQGPMVGRLLRLAGR